MKKYIICLLGVGISLMLSSWGYKGHRVTALVAQDYLTPEAKQGIKAILGHETLADVSTWADDIKSDPAYRETASWHFLNLPLGLSYNDFLSALNNQHTENVYTSIKRCEVTLSNPRASSFSRRSALKFLVHFIGDAHQPMHISRAEDKGGNSIVVTFNNSQTNLHSLWDSNLIDHENLSETNLKQKVESEINPGDIPSYQADALTKWLYESYTIATKLYQDTEKDNNIGPEKYQEYIKIVHQRLALGGVRLAGVLNEVFRVK